MAVWPGSLARSAWRLWLWFIKPLPTEAEPSRLPLFSRERWLGYLPSLLVIVPVLGLVFAVHWMGFEGWPIRQNGDAGVYASQVWAVVFHHELAPFSYFYDHPPGAWLTMALYAFVTRAFQRDPTTLIVVREAMVCFHMISSALLFGLARRMHYRRGLAALAVLIFSLSPLGLQYQREAFIDNVMVMWLIAGLYFMASRRRDIPSAIAAGACFGMAILSKETALAMVPAMIVFFWLNTDPRKRVHRILAHYLPFAGMIGIYLVYAFGKHEFFVGRGHVSLVGTFKWQLVSRKPTGSLLDVHSQTFAMAMNWVHSDPVVLLACVALAPLALLTRRTFTFGFMVVCQIGTVCHNGYMPFAFVTLLYPLAGLVVAGVANNFWNGFAGRRRRDGHHPTKRTLPRWIPRTALYGVRLAVLTGIVGAVLLAFPRWQPQLAQAMEARPDLAVVQAVHYMETHVPRSKLVVTDNDSWTDLREAGFHPAPVDKLQLDPAVRRRLDHGWKDIAYVMSMKFSPSDCTTYSITAVAVDHSVVVAAFGHGASTIYIRKVNAKRPAVAGGWCN
jgi:hypothetical protein